MLGPRISQDGPRASERQRRPLRRLERHLPAGGRERATLELDLKRNIEAPGIARVAATGICRDADVDESTRLTVVLLVSEVVTNAVRHSQAPPDAPIALTVTVHETGVRVTVLDKGSGFVPKPRDPASLDDGYGLYLLEKAAARWGVNPLGGTCVWFEVALPEEQDART